MTNLDRLAKQFAPVADAVSLLVDDKRAQAIAPLLARIEEIERRLGITAPESAGGDSEPGEDADTALQRAAAGRQAMEDWRA